MEWLPLDCSGTFRNSDPAVHWRERNSPEVSCGIAVKELDAICKDALDCPHLSDNAGGSRGAAMQVLHGESGTDEQLAAYLNGSPMTVQASCSGRQQGKRAL